jgi:integrase
VAFFALKTTSLEDMQDQAMAIVAFLGCLRGCELANIELPHLEEVNDGVMVTTIRFKTTNKASRFLIPFIVSNQDFSPARNLLVYTSLVTPWLNSKKLVRLWPRPTKMGFSAQFRGKNHLGNVAKKIAVFLGLNPDKFTGHSFRRSSATAAADWGISLINLKRLGGWKSDAVATSCVDHSLAATKEAASLLLPTKQGESASALNDDVTADKKQMEQTVLKPLHIDLKAAIRQTTSSEQSASIKPSPIVFNICVNNS